MCLSRANSFLVAIPVFNEADSIESVIRAVQHSRHEILVVDDGSSDQTPEKLRAMSDLAVVTHPLNQGYGAALRSAFCYAIRHGYRWVISIDCDGQHEPQRIPEFVAACRADVDIVSGSRYMRDFEGDSSAPVDRQAINRIITGELNERFGLTLTDAFCGFKAYRVSALRRLTLTEDGYAMPLQLWVQAAQLGFGIVELPVPRIYLDPHRSFGGGLDDAATRLAYYRSVIDETFASLMRHGTIRHGLELERCATAG